MTTATTTATSGAQPPRVSSTSLPVRTDVQGGAAAPPGPPASPGGAPAAPEAPPPARRPRTPRTPQAAGAATAKPEPDPEVLEELGRLFYHAALGLTPEAAALAVVERLRAAKRLGEIATLLGVE